MILWKGKKEKTFTRLAILQKSSNFVGQKEKARITNP